MVVPSGSSVMSSAPGSRTARVSSSPLLGVKMTPFLANWNMTEPGSARRPPVFERVFLTTGKVRFLLSVATSMMIPTPPGP